MNTNLSALKQFINYQKCPGTMDKICSTAQTIRWAQERFATIGDQLQLAPRVNNGSFSFQSTFDGLSASGKGATAEQAQASALMELAERYSWLNFEYITDKNYHFCPFEEIPAAEKLPGSYFMANLPNQEFFAPLLPTIQTTPQKWLAAHNLTTSGITCYPLTWHSMTYSSNGLAAGNCLPEAILQGLFEVIERENVARLFIDRLPGRLVDLASCNYQPITTIIEHCQQQHIELTVLDISSDLSLPTFCVIGRRPDKQGTILELGVGQGCHLVPQLALLRALTEYLESLAIQEEHYQKNGRTIDMTSRLLPANHSGFLPTYNQEMLWQYERTISFADIENKAGTNLLDDLAQVITNLAARDFQVLYFEKSHPGLRIPVVRVLVPGMRSMISGAIYSPNLALAQIAIEAGNKELAYNSFLAYTREDPLQKELYSSPLMMMGLSGGKQNPQRFLAKDYRDYYLKSTKLKANADKLLSVLTPLISKGL